jgi:DNA-binding transcriptional MocR family regulator
LRINKEISLTYGKWDFIIWCKINKDFNEIQLLEESIKRAVIYAPGSTMGSKKGFARFTFAREDEESINEGIKRFAEALDFL